MLHSAWPVVSLATGTLANPVGEAFKRVDNGPTDSIPYFYVVMTRRGPDGEASPDGR